jgi:tetratricopeptide (TPR) repeat protein
MHNKRAQGELPTSRRRPETAEKGVNTAPCGHGSQSRRASRDHRKRRLNRLLQQSLPACTTLLMFCVSCTHEVQIASQAPPRTKTHALMARQVENAVDLGDADAEARRWRKRLAANASDLDARLALARLYVSRGQPQLAVEHYRLAAELNPDLAGVTLLLAKSLRDLNEPAEALSVIAAFISRHPKESWELLSLAGILEDEQGLFKQAEAAYRAALAIDPTPSSLHNNLGYNLLLQGNAEGAAAEFRKAIEIDPHSVIAHNNLGTALMWAKSGKSEQAFAEWRKSGDPAAAHNNLAAIFLEQGHYPEARQELASALELRPDYPAALANLRMVAAADGGPATPAPQQKVNLWKRITSGVTKDKNGTMIDKTAGSGDSPVVAQK